MSDVIASLIAYVGADVSDALNGFKQVQSGITDVSQSLLKTGAMLTAGLTVPIVGFLTATVKAASDEESVLAQLNAVLKSTGSVAGVTAKQVTDMADSLSQTTRFSKDAVISGENLLLTFTNISKDIFPETTQTILDMSQALGQDLKSSAIQVGKALQDPVKGVTALQRVGVMLTEAQKKQIQTMVAAGNIMGAQKIILQELQREFGGSAKAAGDTFAGKLDVLNHAFTAFQVKVGNIILPILTKFLGFLSNITDALSKLSPQVIEIGLVIVSALALLGPFLTLLGSLGTVLGFLVSGPIGIAVAALAALGLAFATNFGGIRDLVGPILQNIGNAFSLFMAQIGDFINNVKKFGLSEALLSALNLGDGKKYATGWVQGILEALGVGKDTAIRIVNDLSDLVKGKFSGLADLLAGLWDNAIPRIISGVENVISSIGNWISTTAWPILNNALQSLIGQFADWLYGGGPQRIVDGFTNIIYQVGQWIVSGKAWDVLQSAFIGLFNSIYSFFSGPGMQELINGMVVAIQNLGNWIATKAWPLISGAFTTLWNTITQGFVDAITNGVKSSIAVASGNATPQQAQTAINTAQIIQNPISAAISAISGFFGGPRAGGGDVSAGTPYLVGERGPEIFTPGASGAITPNGGYNGPSTLHIALSLDGAAEHIYLNVADAIAAAGAH